MLFLLTHLIVHLMHAIVRYGVIETRLHVYVQRTCLVISSYSDTFNICMHACTDSSCSTGDATELMDNITGPSCSPDDALHDGILSITFHPCMQQYQVITHYSYLSLIRQTL